MDFNFYNIVPGLIIGILIPIITHLWRLKNKREDKDHYKRSHMYAILMERNRKDGKNIDDLAEGFKIRNQWYDMKGISYEKKLLLIQAGYSPEEARQANKQFTLEELSVQATLNN